MTCIGQCSRRFLAITEKGCGYLVAGRLQVNFRRCRPSPACDFAASKPENRNFLKRQPEVKGSLMSLHTPFEPGKALYQTKADLMYSAANTTRPDVPRVHLHPPTAPHLHHRRSDTYGHDALPLLLLFLVGSCWLLLLLFLPLLFLLLLLLLLSMLGVVLVIMVVHVAVVAVVVALVAWSLLWCYERLLCLLRLLRLLWLLSLSLLLLLLLLLPMNA